MTIQDYKDIMELVISALGVVIPLVILIKEHYAQKRRELAKQVIAYYCLQEEAIAWIKTLAPKEKKIKEKLRKRAQNHVDNVHRTYPSMALREASEYL